jgi:hypothetical protein
VAEERIIGTSTKTSRQNKYLKGTLEPFRGIEWMDLVKIHIRNIFRIFKVKVRSADGLVGGADAVDRAS